MKIISKFQSLCFFGHFLKILKMEEGKEQRKKEKKREEGRLLYELPERKPG